MNKIKYGILYFGYGAFTKSNFGADDFLLIYHGGNWGKFSWDVKQTACQGNITLSTVLLLLEEMRTAVSLSAPNGKLWYSYNEVSKTVYSLRSF